MTAFGRSPPFRIAARPSVLEASPLLLAAKALGAGVAFAPGSVESLFLDGDARADAAGNAETQALRASLDRPDLRIVMTVVEGIYRIVARRSAGIARAADLRGKRIGTMLETSAAYFLHSTLHEAGLREADVEIVACPPLKVADALIAGEVDAIATWEPGAERTARALGSDAVEFRGAGGYRELYNLNTRAEVLADPAKRAGLVELVRAIAGACETCVHRPSEAWPVAAAASGFPVDLIEASWPHHRFTTALAPDLLDVMETEEAWLAARSDRAARPRAVLATLIDASVLAEAQVRPVTHIQ